MKRGLEAKFTQHTDLRRMLLDTGTKKLMFIHPEDIIWGTRKSKSIGLWNTGYSYTIYCYIYYFLII